MFFLLFRYVYSTSQEKAPSECYLLDVVFSFYSAIASTPHHSTSHFHLDTHTGLENHYTNYETHSGFITVLRLANMEMRTENVHDISIFFQLWNEVLADVKGEPGYHFNLTRFMCDSAGANFQGIQCIYGQLAAY